MSLALRLFTRALFVHLRRAGRRLGIRGQPAAVTFIQRFGGLCNLNVHFHTLAADGLFAADGFHALPAPTDEEVAALCCRVAAKVEHALAAHVAEDAAAADALGVAQAVAAQLPLFALADAGHEPDAVRRARRLAVCDGFSLHANRHVSAESRRGLETLCRYGARPPIALGRLGLLPGGQVAYRLKQPLRDGRSVVAFAPDVFVRRLCALVPPPRAHLVRYHGALAPRAKLRAALVPVRRTVTTAEQPPPPPSSRQRVPWAELLRRVFAIDVLRCPRCGGRRTVLAYITEPPVVEKILVHLGLPSRPPPRAHARPPPDVLEPDATSWEPA